jgi:hypothetical protein
MGGFAWSLCHRGSFSGGREAGAAGLLFSALIGMLAYIAAFALALALDQPFGPVLALLLIVVGLLIA